MPKVRFEADELLCHHNKAHGNWTTADGRVMGICMMADQHIHNAQHRLSQALNLAYNGIYNATNEKWMLETFNNDIGLMENKLLLLDAELKRRKYRRARQ